MALCRGSPEEGDESKQEKEKTCGTVKFPIDLNGSKWFLGT